MPQKLTNDSDLNVKLINKWVADKTNKKITELITDVDPFTSFVLLNSVYFNGKWGKLTLFRLLNTLPIYFLWDCVSVSLCFTGKWKTVFESTNKREKFTTFSDQAKDVLTLYSSKYSLQMGYLQNLKAEVSIAMNAQGSFSGNGAIYDPLTWSWYY